MTANEGPVLCKVCRIDQFMVSSVLCIFIGNYHAEISRIVQFE